MAVQAKTVTILVRVLCIAWNILGRRNLFGFLNCECRRVLRDVPNAAERVQGGYQKRKHNQGCKQRSREGGCQPEGAHGREHSIKSEKNVTPRANEQALTNMVDCAEEIAVPS
ncbi:MAG: hypothetical protein ABI450_07845 [Rhizomicrobium sp.]